MKTAEISEKWNLNKARLKKIIRAKVGKQSDGEDILQEVFIKFWMGYPAIRDSRKTGQWLDTTTRTTIADFYRSKKKPGDLAFNSPDTVADAATHETDESKKLLPIIYSLPVRYKTVLLMSEIFGLSHRVIAEQLEVSIPCIKTRIVRGRRLLAEKMRACCSFSYDAYGNIIECEEKTGYRECLKHFKNNR